MALPPVFSLSTKWVLDARRNPPIYTRPLLGSELIMQKYVNAFDGQTEACFGVDFVSSLKTEILQDRARVALDKLRFICPIIACDIEDVVTPRWVYTPSNDREAWLGLALVVQEQGKSLDSTRFVQSINLKRLPYADDKGVRTHFRAYLLTTMKDPESEDERKEYGLYFHGSHSMLDLGPAYHALNLMLEWISGEGMDVNIEPLEEWKNLPVDPITATGGRSDVWETFGKKLLQESMEQYDRTSPLAILPPPTRPLDISKANFRHIITTSESNTTAMIAKTKQLGISVAALFHAAHSLVQIKMNPMLDTLTDVDFPPSTVLVSLDRYLKPPINPKTHLISSVTLMPTRFSMAGPLSERTDKARLIATAKLLQARFNRYLADPCFPQLFSVITSMEQDELKPNEDVVIVGQEEGSQVSLSPWNCCFHNLGDMERKIRKEYGPRKAISIEDICFGGRSHTWMRVHLWTMHSKFHLQVQGASVWGDELMKTLIEDMLKMAMLILDEP